MYGMEPKSDFIEQAIRLLSDEGSVIVIHRDGSLDFDSLVCQHIATYPTATVDMDDTAEILDVFAPFVAGFKPLDSGPDYTIRDKWRQTCRNSSKRDVAMVGYLKFSSPTTIVVFNQHARKLSELSGKLFLRAGDRRIKSPEARQCRPAAVVKPTGVRDIEDCVRWALNHKLKLSVLGGSHIAQCLQNHVVAIDMSLFSEVHIVEDDRHTSNSDQEPKFLAVAQAGCTSGNIIRKTMETGLTVPLGARPSVGAGLWLQGGIGHLARMHGLACDSIVGAVLVSVDEAQVLFVGHVPKSHRPEGALRAAREDEILWALKGAGTNFGIVTSVVFKTYKAPTYSVKNWIISPSSRLESAAKLGEVNVISEQLPKHCSLDAFLYYQDDQLYMGFTLFEVATEESCHAKPPASATARLRDTLGPEKTTSNVVDSLALFESEMYVSGMHDGHGGGKTSSFKRCIFLKSVRDQEVMDILLHALEIRPSPSCYVHLLHGGGAVRDVPASATAFGSRDWDLACVITGVWRRDLDGTHFARESMEWVYDVVGKLFPLSAGVYGADLGPDPRDAALAIEAFGRNTMQLGRLKDHLDPHNTLSNVCPLPRRRTEPRLIVLVTGDACAGKDYCADVWARVLGRGGQKVARHSISAVTKHQYATVGGIDFKRLVLDRDFKEQHRRALTAFFQRQVQRHPWLPEEHFLHVVYEAKGEDVLIVTGMREGAPVTAFSHLMPHSRLLDVRVNTSERVRQSRGGVARAVIEDSQDTESTDYYPSLVFCNDAAGEASVYEFAESSLLPFVSLELERLADMIRLIPGFPSPGVEFRHVLDIAQSRGGLQLCTSLLEKHFVGDWSRIDAIACCESSGFVFGSVLAARVEVPLALIRETGRLPPPRVSSLKIASHISALSAGTAKEKMIEMDRDVIPQGGSVVLVDDVFATDKTVSAMIKLLEKVGVHPDDITLLVVAEFPLHRGRAHLRQNGFGGVRVQSLLVFGGR